MGESENSEKLRVLATVCVASTVFFGLSSVRAFWPQMSFLLRDRLGWSATEIGQGSLALFALGFTVALVIRVLGISGKLFLFTSLLPLARLASQLWHGDPIGDLLISIVAVASFFFALSALLTILRAIAGGGASLAVGFILGVLADVGLHSLLGTWDLAWHRGMFALGVQGILVAMALVIFWRFRALWVLEGKPHGDLSRNAALGWLGLGPFLFLLLVQLANPGRYAALLEESTSLAWMLIAAAQVTALVIVTAWLRRGGSPGALLLFPAIVILVAILWQPWPVGLWASLQVFLGGLLATLFFALVAIGIDASPPESGARRLSWAHGGTLLIFGVLVFIHASAFVLPLPLIGERLYALAALGLGVAAFGSAGVLHEFPPPGRRGWRPWQAAGLALALPSLFVSWTSPEGGRVAAQPVAEVASVRVMTYNVHCGVDPMGDLGLEALARSIEAENPDVVALQEVTRGWTVNGSVDMIEWLAGRLRMDFVFAGTADPIWGNAVLSRLPILGWQSMPLPSEKLKIKRGTLDVTLGLGGGESLRLMTTHLHHRREGSSIRQEQTIGLLEQWRVSRRTVIVGDLNAEPDSAEIDFLRRAGLVDAFEGLGSAEGLTFPSTAPIKRIDYIWHSQDLAASRSWVPQTVASDHLPVVTELRLDMATANQGFPAGNPREN